MKEHLLEKEVQQLLIEDLRKRRTPNDREIRVYAYGKNGFLPLEDKKRFDLLIFHNHNNFASPIAVELKPNLAGFNEITKALHDQIPERYLGKKFVCEKESWSGIPPIFAFTTKHAIFDGIIYKNNYPNASNFFVNRFAWRFNVGVLYKIRERFWLTHQNKNYCMETNEIRYPLKVGETEREF